jgi:polysaccharide biosynthesis PFTS motif protein
MLREERFATLANFDLPLIEVRSFRTILFRHPNFTIDASTHILRKVLPRRSYRKIFSAINKEISSQGESSAMKIKNFKESQFDPIVYSLFFTQIGNMVDLITTPSSMLKVPSAFLIAGGPKRIMIWYSTNSKPIYASDDILRKKINVRGFKEHVDEHWVWNEDQVNFLKSQEIGNALSVGSMIFQDRIIEDRDSKIFVITYFDVTPVQGSTGFYSVKNTMLVLNSVLRLFEVLNERHPGRIIVQVKPKRQYSKFYSEEYVSLVLVSSKLGKITRLSASANLYQTISKSDLVLAIPFTSPALIARELEVNSLFVSIGIDGWDVPASSNGIPVIFEFDELLSYLEKEIQRKFKL